MTTPLGSMHHVGIVVRDLEQAEAFVTGVVGLPVVNRLSSEALGVSMVFLDCGPTLVELIQFADPQIVQSRLGDRVAAIDHIALEVADLEHVTRTLAGHGVETVQPVPSTTPLGRFHFTRPDTSAGIIWQLLELAGGTPAGQDATLPEVV